MPSESDSRTTADKKPTKRMIELLRWASDAGTYETWPIEMSVIHRKALDAGYVERCRQQPGYFGLARFQISDRGRKVLNQ